MSDEIRNLEKDIEVLSGLLDEVCEERDEALRELEELKENFGRALSMFLSGKFERCFRELEEALPDGFIGFADAVLAWKARP